ncbi:MAG TPA: glucoamylase family protein [Bryobacteraceae bacterium]
MMTTLRRGGLRSAETEREVQIADDELLDKLQRAAFGYFQETVNAGNGLVADTTRDGSPCSIAVVGFALSCWLVAAERRWITHEEAAKLVLTTLRFFHNSPQDDTPVATGYKGFFYHFLDMQTGQRVWRSELSMVDTAFLVAGMLSAATYFDRDKPDEAEIRRLAVALYSRIDWPWAQSHKRSVTHGWKPEYGFLHYGWYGYSEASILYVLGLASPTRPLPPNSYARWTSTYQWENLYGQDFLYAGPLFIHQFAHVWIDFNGIRDQFMREKNSDYFENSRRATLVQQQYAIRNPRSYVGYGENCWGFSAGDGPETRAARVHGGDLRFSGYAARGVPYGPDDGTISPPAILGSLPFAPDIALPAIRHILASYPDIATEHRFPSGFNPTSTGAAGSSANPGGWVSKGYFGLDQGLIVLMIENHRSQMLWKLMRTCPYIRTGLRRAGFRGGWVGRRSFLFH